MIKAALSWLMSYRIGQLRYMATKTYLESASQLRQCVTLMFGVIFFISLFISGLLIATVGVIIRLPLSVEDRALSAIVIGMVFIAAAWTGYIILNSEKMWMKYMRVESFLKKNT